MTAGLRTGRRLVAMIGVIILGISAAARAQSAVDGFDPGANGDISAVAVQPDGKILVGGSFTTIGGGGTGATALNRIARLNADGSIDASFNPGTGANNAVLALAVQPDGKILVAGRFTTLRGSTRNRIGRLNADGSLDNDFNPDANNWIYALAIQPDGKILIGGLFTIVGSGANATPRKYLARLDSDGKVDTSFDPGANARVGVLALQPDGMILVGGDFTKLGGTTGTTDRTYLGRLTAGGLVDSFNPGASSNVYALAVQPDGKVVVGGFFTKLAGGAVGVPTTTRNRIGRLNRDGSLDTAFDPGANNGVLTLARQPDGKILAGGTFTTLGGKTRNRIGRLNFDGSLDDSFNPGASSSFSASVSALAVQADGKIVVGGFFTALGGGTGTATRNYLGRVHGDGALDTTFNPLAPSGSIYALAIQPDGKILVGGAFTSIGAGSGTPRNHLARLNADGTLDAFDPGANDNVYVVAVQPDGKILVGGTFTTLAGQTCNRIGRLTANGAFDTCFNGGADAAVYALTVQADGKILVGGTFTKLGSQDRLKVGRLNVDGSLDETFNPGADSQVWTIALQGDGKILLGGIFTKLGGGTGTTRRRYLGRLNADGTLDDSFDPGATYLDLAPAVPGVFVLALQADGKILAGGNFTGIGGGTGTTPRRGLARLNANGTVDAFNPGASYAESILGIPFFPSIFTLVAQPDGKILIGGRFTGLGGGSGATPRNNIGRLNADGSVDASFDPGANSFVYALAAQSDGKILVGGSFGGLGAGGGTLRSNIGRLTNTSAAIQSLAVANGGTTITWLRSGAGPEPSRVTFESSTDGATYTSLGSGTGISGGWQLTGPGLTAVNQNLFIRARGYYGTGHFNGSASIVESVRNAYVSCATITPTTVPAGVVGTLYSTTTFTAAGALGTVTLGQTGTLPAGMTFSAGVLSGTPTQSGSFPITVTATDASSGCTTSQNVTLTIACPTITLSATTFANGTAGTAYPSTGVTQTGGSGTTTFAVTSGALPSGLSLSSAGVLTGTPTATGTFNFTVTATDANGCTGSKAYTLTVACPTITLSPTNLFNAAVGTAYAQTFTQTGGVGSVTFAVTSGALPSGFSLSPAGVLTGTPTGTGAFAFTVTATDENGCKAARNYTLTTPIAGYVYALQGVSGASNQIYGFSVDPKTKADLTLLPGFPVSTSGNGGAVQTTRQLLYDRANARLYALNGGSSTISVFSVDPLTGALAALPHSPIPLPSGGWTCLALNDTGSVLVAGSFNPAQAASFLVTGASATAASGNPVSTGAPSSSCATSQDGAYFYTGGSSGNSIAELAIDAVTGTLTPLNGSPFDSGSGNPWPGATDSAGRVFTSHYFTGQLRVFTTSAGVLAPVTGNPFTSGLTGPVDSIVHPSGFYLVADSTRSWVGVYQIGGSGSATTLTAVTGSPFATAGGSITGLALDRTGTYLFAAHGISRRMTTFAVNTSTGVLTELYTGPGDTVGSTGFIIGLAFTGLGARLDVTKAGSGTITSDVGGLSCGATCSRVYDLGSTIALTATPSAGFRFAGWSGGGCSGTGTCSVTVSAATTVTATFQFLIDPATLSAGTSGVAYTQTLTPAGGASPFTFSLASGTLPAGVSLSSGGVVSGTPTVTGTSSFTVTATDASGLTGSASYSLAIGCPAITLAPTTLVSATIGVAYSQSIAQSGGVGTTTFAVTSGALPGGLSLSTAGALTGTPAVTGTFTFTVTATDANGCTGSKAYTLTIACPTIALSPASLANGTVDLAYPSTTITQTGGAGTTTFAVTSGALPAGLTLSSAGVVGGTPTATGTSTFTITATDANSCTGTRSYTVSISPPSCPTITLSPAALPNGTTGVAYSSTITQSGAVGTATFAVTSGALPAGLTLSSAGVLSGSPTATGTSTFTVTATDANTCVGTRSYTVTINSQPCPTITLSPSAVPNGTAGVAYSSAITQDGGVGTATFAVTGGALPAGLTLSSAGILSGTPTETGASTFTVVATDANGCSGARSYAISINPAPTPTVTLTPTTVNFGAVNDGAGTLTVQTPAQTLALTQSGAGAVTWSASANQPWITVTPAAGTGPATLSVAINNTGFTLPPTGALAGTVTISTTGATNSPTAAINLTVAAPNTTTGPVGVIDTPADGQQNVTGSIPVTGWAIDDIGVARVRIWRDPVPAAGEAAGAQVFIGDAVFVTGARPDITAAYPTRPYADRAGWGYLLLTNFLPAQGNGTFTLYAYAEDIDGQTTLLGSKTITCTNATATAPFGAIDTPTQGGTVSGSAFVNFGWALTPNPKSIAANGSTIQVFVDSVSIGTLDSYNNARVDIQSLFPGYANTDGAVGVKTIDSTQLTNGVHTIAWIVTDNAGAADGIGSRFFTVSNSSLVAGLQPGVTGSARVIATAQTAAGAAAALADVAVTTRALPVTRGFDPGAVPDLVIADHDGVRHVHTSPLELIRVALSPLDDGDVATYRAYALDGDALKDLPVGSTLDAATGVFSWAPGLAFGGTHALVFVRTCAHGREQIRVDVAIRSRD